MAAQWTPSYPFVPPAKLEDGRKTLTSISSNALVLNGLATFRVVATRKLELRGDIPASHMGSRSTTPLLRNPADVRHCSQHAGANIDFGDEGAVDWALMRLDREAFI